MIAVHIKTRADGRYDMYVYDRSIDGELLVSSNQGYEREADAEKIARRLFSPTTEPAIPGPEGSAVGQRIGWEHVDLTVTYLDGTGRHEMLR